MDAADDRDGDADFAGRAIKRGRRVACVRSIRPSDRDARPASMLVSTTALAEGAVWTTRQLSFRCSSSPTSTVSLPE
jgi:hypothetical protein